ncbi:response regulator transcription factor [Pseudooctadecabacter jejudonensis]|uniref:Transcriptional regulatory protein CusR n=1 Tax=Pseudooctadecabacter jejudonensis TaxID=1391910 RepID=A0A1Y5RR57_9RHOB|nr:response regulator transcription factor [Pseudooctadecabacter jejudonensis]SLN20565.1 Transcriptional regulatory protein CusR [Pseudooctadecabacter jejudonensis]
MNILIIEDDAETGAYLTRGLQEAGWDVQLCTAAQEGILAVSTRDFDAVVLDRMLPGMDGVDALRLMRGAGVTTPVLMLTARTAIHDRVEGLEAGADDYLLKPFAMSELLARLKIIARRPARTPEVTEMTVGPLHINRVTRVATREGTDLDLSPLEFRLLDFLMGHAGEVVTRTILLEQVWGYRFDPKTSLVQTHMSRLRAKVDKPFDEEVIRTVRGAGYVLG